MISRDSTDALLFPLLVRKRWLYLFLREPIADIHSSPRRTY